MSTKQRKKGILACIRMFLLVLISFIIIANCEKTTNSVDSIENDVTIWKEVENPTTKHLNSVYFVSENDGWVVGESGTIIHYYGSEWNLVKNPTTVGLSAVYFNSSTNGWAVGDWGTILHYNGSSWQVVYTDSSIGTWTSVYFTSASNGWVCGLDGSIMHYDGVNWTLDYHINGAIWQSLYFTSEDEGWVVGYKGKAHYTNGMWTYVDSLNRCFNDLFMLPSTSGWATSSPAKSGPNSALTWYYDGTGWDLVDNPAPDDSWGLSGIYFTDENNGWAVGGRWSEENNNTRGYIIYYNGISWTLTENSLGDYLQSVYFLSQNEGWAVGWSGTIVHYGD